MVGDSTVKRTVSYRQKKAASLETAFSKPTLERGPGPLIPRQVVPEGNYLWQCSQSVVERLRLLDIKFAEILLNVNPLGEFLAPARHHCCFCGTYTTKGLFGLLVKNQCLT
jgi:hypothetical protein